MINLSQPDIGLGNLISRRAILSPNLRALTFEGQTYTYSEMSDRISRLASALRAGGVSRGDRVGYIGFNHPVFLETIFAASSLGAVFVPLNFRLTGPEIIYAVNDSGIHTLVSDNVTLPVVEAERDKLQCQRFITCEENKDLPLGWEAISQLLSAHDPLANVERVEESDVAVIMYTSGTTGRPKGAMLTHGNFYWNNINTCISHNKYGAATLTCAPLFHIAGLNVTTLLSLIQGIEVILHRNFDPKMVLADIERFKVGCVFGAPTMFLMMSQQKSFGKTDLSSIHSFICGGAPVPLPLIKLYSERGITFIQGYGLTETAPFASVLTGDMSAKKAGSAGTEMMFTEICILDDDGNSVAVEVPGEVCIRGANVMKGYWNKPEATADAIDAKGWFHSGDVGYLDSEGYLYLCDRLKDMVISGGENIYPAEVESVLYEHPAINEVAVIGLPDDKWGETVCAIVVINEGKELDLEQLRTFAGKNLARYKLPTRMHVLDILPRNPSGKVLKFELKKMY